MEEFQTNKKPEMFNKLTREQKFSLRVEFNKTAEVKKMNKMVGITAAICAVVAIMGVIIGIITNQLFNFIVFTLGVICLINIWSVMRINNKFKKWLANEKNIIM